LTGLSRALVWSHLIARIAGSNHLSAWLFVSRVCCVLLPLRQLITRSEECYQVCCVYSFVIYKTYQPRSDLGRSAIEEK